MTYYYLKGGEYDGEIFDLDADSVIDEPIRHFNPNRYDGALLVLQSKDMDFYKMIIRAGFPINMLSDELKIGTNKYKGMGLVAYRYKGLRVKFSRLDEVYPVLEVIEDE